jgi:hypothetical protein
VPTGAVVEVIVSIPPLIANVRFPESAVWGVVALSATCTAKLDAPAVVGVPEMVPLVLRDNPAGKGFFAGDTTVHVYGAVPPVAENVAL